MKIHSTLTRYLLCQYEDWRALSKEARLLSWIRLGRGVANVSILAFAFFGISISLELYYHDQSILLVRSFTQTFPALFTKCFMLALIIHVGMRILGPYFVNSINAKWRATWESDKNE